MPRTCTVCRHPKRGEIEQALLAGESLRDISKRVSLSRASLFRHKAHLPKTLAKAHEAREVAHADALVAQLTKLAADARRIQTKAEASGDLRAALAAIGALSRLVELAVQLSREQAIPIDEARELFVGLARLVRDHVHDAAALRAIGEGFAKLTEQVDGRIREAEVPL